jgi:simple sugar transport system ATP-binding protein
MTDIFLSLKNISKHFVGVAALDHVDFEINKGEIHCLVGENGSGKSTLIKIISGTVAPDEGAQITMDGHPVHDFHAIDSIHRGIEIIYQDLSLFPNLSVAENIALGEYIASGRRLVNQKNLKKIAREAIDLIGANLPLDALVGTIAIADQQLVAICRALTHNVHLLIMDEPTAALTKKEVDALLSVVKDMREKGIATIFVSHKLDEVMQVAERVTVLRDGKLVGTFPASELNDEKLTLLMTGKKVKYTPYLLPDKPGDPILETRALTMWGNFKDINLKLYPGDILGITGLLGSGRTELAMTLFGVTPPDSGEIFFQNKPIRIRSIQDAIRLGIGYVPEDRLVQGLVMNQSVEKNLTVTILDDLVTRFKLLDQRKLEAGVNRWVKDLAIKVASVEAPVQTLSGGNQQRVVLAKWIATHPKVLILDGPTIGVDVSAKFSMHETIRKLAQQGIAIILISEEVSEVFYNCNRVQVMRKGRFVAEFETQKTTLDEIQACVDMTN